MHTDMIQDEEGNFWNIHHSAYPDNGDIIVNREADENKAYPNIHIPVEIMIEFVGRKMMSDHISKLEQMTGKEVLEMLNDG